MSKKSFKDNPALQFMSRAEKDVGSEAREESSVEIAGVREIKEVKEFKEVKEVTSSIRMMPLTFEAKSKRFNMLIRPSVFANLKEMSENRGTSVNDLINTIVENYIENNGK